MRAKIRAGVIKHREQKQHLYEGTLRCKKGTESVWNNVPVILESTRLENDLNKRVKRVMVCVVLVCSTQKTVKSKCIC